MTTQPSMVRVAPKSKSGGCHRELPCRGAGQAAGDDRGVIAGVNRTSRRSSRRTIRDSDAASACPPPNRPSLAPCPAPTLSGRPGNLWWTRWGRVWADPRRPAWIRHPAVTCLRAITDNPVAAQADRWQIFRAGLSTDSSHAVSETVGTPLLGYRLYAIGMTTRPRHPRRSPC
jgi:hypothetical protein